MENWVEIKGAPGYMVSSEGRVLGPRGKVLKQEHCPDGYRRVNIYGSHKMVHRIVAMAFIPNPGNLEQVNHKDEVRSNNSVLGHISRNEKGDLVERLKKEGRIYGIAECFPKYETRESQYYENSYYNVFKGYTQRFSFLSKKNN